MVKIDQYKFGKFVGKMSILTLIIHGEILGSSIPKTSVMKIVLKKLMSSSNLFIKVLEGHSSVLVMSF